jgi:Domain of unknown function (DUF4262)
LGKRSKPESGTSREVNTRTFSKTHTIVFREVDRQHNSDYVGYALWFYEDDPFPLMQCFWPARKGFSRGTMAATITSKNEQPLLFVPSR